MEDWPRLDCRLGGSLVAGAGDAGVGVCGVVAAKTPEPCLVAVRMGAATSAYLGWVAKAMEGSPRLVW